ncbi:NADH dehydrogenase subunit 3 (mitochondrion) [Aplysia californica]|uniref:NADH-ubiquinone oxidoreductase chain 3 n=1 Tax=Aplysia californica TaxID=6500 RepID=Q6Q0B0_APLCA|nr:NADH dehydrogenase subunit 3 [Aplysia californica]AAS67866.1 NADH dehydrogenase subunit 3 [Aplysia californica]
MLSMMILFSSILCSALLIIYYLVSYIEYTSPSEKMTSFECGFDPLSKMRAPFSTRFFLLVVLFLIFDVEVALLFPILSLMMLNSVSFMLMVALLLFLVILLFGMFHEWNEGALDWVSSSTGQLSMS